MDFPETALSNPHRGASQPIRGTGVFALLKSVFVNRQLVNELSRREITDMHAGHAAGAAWALIHPLVMFVVYAFLFTGVFKVRIGDHGPTDYLIYLFAGLSPWFITQDILSRATSIMFVNSSIVKKVMIPTEVLVAKCVLASIKVQSIFLALLFVYSVWTRAHVPLTFALLPLLLALHLTLVWGLALGLSALSPYFRDLSEFVRIFLVVNIYLMPVMYQAEMVPEGLRFVLSINPFSHLIWCYQDVFYSEAITHPLSWGVVVVMALAALWIGSYIFIRLRNHFASVV